MYDGRVSARGMVMQRPFLHVIALRPRLEEWARREGVPVQAIQPEKHRGVAHIDVFGQYAERLLERMRRREEVAKAFGYFGRSESLLYAELAAEVAEDDDLLDLAGLAAPGQPPPNLLFAAVHYLLLKGAGHPLARHYPSVSGSPIAPAEPAFPAFKDFCEVNTAPLRRLLTTRLVQTNDPGRCAILLPALALLAQKSEHPLALVELGSSAGLNLLLDRYAYDYSGRRLGESSLCFTCDLRGDLRPDNLHIPRLASRLGLDLHPVDVRDPDQDLWLRALVWPDQPERATQLLAAIALARPEPPRLIRGDAAADVGRAADLAADGELCVVSSFLWVQLGEDGQQRLLGELARISRRRRVHFVRFEWELGRPGARLELMEFESGEVGDQRPLAVAHEHGRWLEWLDPESSENATS